MSERPETGDRTCQVSEHTCLLTHRMLRVQDAALVTFSISEGTVNLILCSVTIFDFHTVLSTIHSLNLTSNKPLNCYSKHMSIANLIAALLNFQTFVRNRRICMPLGCTLFLHPLILYLPHQSTHNIYNIIRCFWLASRFNCLE